MLIVLVESKPTCGQPWLIYWESLVNPKILELKLVVVLLFFFGCFFRILSILTHTHIQEREEKVLKKQTVVYIQKKTFVIVLLET